MNHSPLHRYTWDYLRLKDDIAELFPQLVLQSLIEVPAMPTSEDDTRKLQLLIGTFLHHFYTPYECIHTSCRQYFGSHGDIQVCRCHQGVDGKKSK